MSIEIKKKLRRNCMKNIISIITLLLIAYGQGYAQWLKTNLPSTVKVNTLAISDSSIFAGTNGDGIFISKDNGVNWDSLNVGLDSKVIHSIFINGTTIFAGTEAGASFSTNNGLNWSTINSGLAGKGVWSFAVSDNKFSTSTIFAGTWSGIYTSSNNGTSWEVTGLSSTTMPVHTIIVHDPSNIFAATLGGGVFKSQNNGFSWNDISIEFKDENISNSSIIPVYSLAGIDTTLIAGVAPGNFYHMPYYGSLFVLLPTIISQNVPILCFSIRNTSLFAGNLTGSIFLSNANGLKGWQPVSPSLTNQTVYSLALNKSYIFAGTESGIWRLWYPDATTNVDNFNKVPIGFALEQNYPNPFNPTTSISYSIPRSVFVNIKVYDLLGREVSTIVSEYKPVGNYRVQFKAGKLVSGIYFYTMQAGAFVQTKKIILLK